MIKRISERLVSGWLNNNVIKQEQFRAYAYGCELLVSEVISTGIVMIAAILMNKVVEMIIFLLVFTCIRVVCGGYHASSYKKCITIFSISSILLFFVTGWFVDRELYGWIILFLGISDVLIVIFAPVDSQNRPLEDEEKKKYRKKTISRLILFNVVTLLIYVSVPYLADKMAYAFVAIIYAAAFLLIGIFEKKYLQWSGKAI